VFGGGLLTAFMIDFTFRNRIISKRAGLVPDRWQMFRCGCLNTSLISRTSLGRLERKMSFDHLTILIA
jgi:hypothetical protein